MNERASRVVAGVRATSRYVLTILWLASGITKLVGLGTFESILFNHGVLSDRVVSLAWVVPVVETALGVVIFTVGGGRRFPRMLRGAGAVSGGLLILFCVYISRVPEEIFRTVGCGCQGAFGLTDLVGSPSRAMAIAINLALVAVSVCLWLPRAPTKEPA